MGQGKAVSPQKAIENAIVDARKHMIMVPLHEKTTILHRVDAKFGACKVMIKPNLPGACPVLVIYRPLADTRLCCLCM